MSTYEEERGSVILPSVAVVPLRNALTEVVNQRRAYVLEVAEKIHAHLRSEAGKEDRKSLSRLMRGKTVEGVYSVETFMSQLRDKLYPTSKNSWGETTSNMKFHVGGFEVSRLLITRPTEPGEPKRMQAPKKKDIPQLLASKIWQWHCDDEAELSIALDPKTRKLSWHIPENNHSVDRARDSYLGRVFFDQLGKVKWTRGTGGVSYYSNEYMRDSAMEGGSAVDGRGWGPLGERETYVPRPRRRKMK